MAFFPPFALAWLEVDLCKFSSSTGESNPYLQYGKLVSYRYTSAAAPLALSSNLTTARFSLLRPADRFGPQGRGHLFPKKGAALSHRCALILVSHSVGFEPTPLGFGNLRSTGLN